MRIAELTVDNFRNHTHTTLQLDPGVNVLVGPNGQGKTNLLEAIYLSCVGRGCLFTQILGQSGKNDLLEKTKLGILKVDLR